MNLRVAAAFALTCALCSGAAFAQQDDGETQKLLRYAPALSSSAGTAGENADGAQYGGGQCCVRPGPPVNRGGAVATYEYPEPWLNHFAFESGIGFTAPLGGAADSVNTAYTFTEGVGYNYSPYFALLGEYGFSRFGLSDGVLKSVGAPDGNVHLWSLTVEPEVRINPQDQVTGYVIGGGGYYHVLTSLTSPTTGTTCDPFYGCYPTGSNTPYAQQSSSQGGWNIGGGAEYKPFGYSRLGVYAEARFLWLDTPGRHSEFFPITFGVRF